MLRFPLPFLTLTFALSIVAASHMSWGRCDSGGEPAVGIVELSSGSADATFYLDDRNYVTGNGIWLYVESNGVWTSQGAGIHRGDAADHNLQRGGPCGYAGECAEICSDIGEWDPDLILF